MSGQRAQEVNRAILALRVQSDDLVQRERLDLKVIRVRLGQVEQRAWLEHLAGMEQTGKRVRWAELELLGAKGIQAKPDQMALLEKLVTRGLLVTREKGETRAWLGSRALLVLMVSKDQRVNEEILDIRGHQEKKELRDLRAHLVLKAKWEEEETLEQREYQGAMGLKERRENEVRREAEAGRGKTD